MLSITLKPFQVGVGLCQDCLLSSLLFLVFMVKIKMQARLKSLAELGAGSNIPVRIAGSPYHMVTSCGY